MTKSKLWLPTPAQTSETIRVSGKIFDAKYNKLEGCVTVFLETPKGHRVAAIHKSSVKFHGKDPESISEGEVDHEMEVTADLFRKAKGRNVNIEISKEQVSQE